jgi:hypothetical protein
MCRSSSGFGSSASGENAQASGRYTTASGNNSFASGYITSAPSFTETTFGSYNTTYTPASNIAWELTDRLFVIGNGTASDSRSNALTVLKNGKVAIGHDAPSEMLDVNGNARVRSVPSGAYSAPLNLTVDGTFTTATSDKRLKENILPLNNSLDKVMKLQGVSFTWKKNPELGTKIGFVAQDVKEVIPELVFTNPADGYVGINYAEMSAVLAEAIKEQQKIIESLELKNDFLQAKVEQINAVLEQLQDMLKTKDATQKQNK